jgi:RNA methyltransferase, TrmH family
MIENISSVQNPKIKNIVRLLEKASERKQQNLIVIEGEIEIEMAIKGGFEVIQLFFCTKLLTKNYPEKNYLEKLKNISKNAIQLTEVTEQVFEKIAYRDGSMGVVALAKPKKISFETLKLSQNPLLLVLEKVEKPGNLGAILRTADAANVDAVIICDPQTDIYNPNVIRSGIGCVFTKQVVACSNKECIAFLKEKDISIFSTALTASKPYTEINFTVAAAIVMGTEATGLTQEWMENSTQNIIIPMLGEIDSMNVSVSAAIVVFEALRQRNLVK